MSLQTLLISVLVTCVTVGATFFYFRNRMQRTEQKVDLMFSLIQEHESNAKLRQQFQPRVIPGGIHQNANQEQFVPQEMHNAENELINISDDDGEDESDYDSDDSDEVSDGEDKLKIDDEGSGDENLDTIKTISLSLEGAEMSSNDINISDIQGLEEHNIVETVNDSFDLNKSDNQELVMDNLEIINNQSFVDIESTPVFTEIKDDDDLDNINLSDDDGATDATIKTDDVGAITDYSKLTAKKLKEIAREKGLEAKGLKKKELVELLSGSQ
jgi:hypothetical protein